MSQTFLKSHLKNFNHFTFDGFLPKNSFLSLPPALKFSFLWKYNFIKSELQLQKEFDYSFWQHLQLLTRGDRHKNMYLLYAWLGKHFLSKIDERMALCCFVKQSSSSTIKEYWGVIQSQQFLSFKISCQIRILVRLFITFFKISLSVTKFWSPKWLIIKMKWIRLWLRIISMTHHYFYSKVM